MTRVQQRCTALLAALALLIGCALAAALPQAAHATVNETRLAAGTTTAKATNLALTGRGLTAINYATFNTTNDNNWYKFTTSNRNSRYGITLKADSNDGTIFFTVYDSGMHRFYTSQLTTNTQASIILSKLKHNSTYYVEVWRFAVDSPLYRSDVPYADYRLRVKEIITKPAPVQNFRVKSKSKYKITVAFTRSFYATGYQVRYQRAWEADKSKSFYYRRTTSTVYTFPTRFHDETHPYRVSVRPYREVNGRAYCGKWSKVRKVIVK